MADTAVTMIAHLTIENTEGYRIYEKGFFPILKRFKGEFITYDDKLVVLEGDGQEGSRIIMFKFPSEAIAHEWYNDPEYQELAKDRINSTKTHSLTMVHGIPARS